MKNIRAELFAIAEVMSGKLNALVKNIMCQTGETDPNEAVRLINSGEWIVSKPTRSWREEDGVIYFSVISDGNSWKLRQKIQDKTMKSRFSLRN